MNWRWHECFLKCHTKRKIILHPRTDLIKSVKIEAAIARRASIFGQTLTNTTLERLENELKCNRDGFTCITRI